MYFLATGTAFPLIIFAKNAYKMGFPARGD
jgi:hypothetical protein